MGLGAWTKGLNAARIFVHSLRHNHYTGAIVLGVAADLPESERNWMKRNKVTAREVNVTTCKGGRGLCDAMDDRIPMALARFMWYRTWLVQGGYTGYVLVADVRDVFFQADPFANLLVDHLRPYVQVAREFGYDDPIEVKADKGKMMGSTIARSGFTRGWIQGCLGSKALNNVIEMPVLCSGSTVGTRLGMERYLEIMEKQIRESMATGNPGCYAYGVDQGFHNYLIHTRVLEGATDLEIDSPEIGSPSQILMTIGTMCVPPPSRKGKENPPDHSYDKVLPRDKEGYVIRKDGSKAPLVHQHDRCFNLFTRNGWLNQHYGKPPPAEM